VYFFVLEDHLKSLQSIQKVLNQEIMDKLKQMEAFVQAADLGSLANAARVIGITPAMLGRRITALEQRLGVRLLHRTTRYLGLTEEGTVFHDHCKSLLADLESAEEFLTSARHGPAGHLNVTAPSGFGRRHVAPHGPAFLSQHPQVQLSFHLDDRVTDVTREGYDIAIRIGGIYDLDLVAVRLAENRRVVCAAPLYLKRKGVPRTLADLEQHNCLAFNPLGGQQGGWDFVDQEKLVRVRVRGNPDCNDGEMLHLWACQGLGLAWRSTWEIQGELARGELVTVLDDFTTADYDIYAVYPQQPHVPAKIKFFVKHLREIYQRPNYWT